MGLGGKFKGRICALGKAMPPGLSLSLSNPVIDALQGAANTAEALGNTDETEDLLLSRFLDLDVTDAATACANDSEMTRRYGVALILGRCRER